MPCCTCDFYSSLECCRCLALVERRHKGALEVSSPLASSSTSSFFPSDWTSWSVDGTCPTSYAVVVPHRDLGRGGRGGRGGGRGGGEGGGGEGGGGGRRGSTTTTTLPRVVLTRRFPVVDLAGGSASEVATEWASCRTALVLEQWRLEKSEAARLLLLLDRFHGDLMDEAAFRHQQRGMHPRRSSRGNWCSHGERAPQSRPEPKPWARKKETQKDEEGGEEEEEEEEEEEGRAWCSVTHSTKKKKKESPLSTPRVRLERDNQHHSNKKVNLERKRKERDTRRESTTNDDEYDEYDDDEYDDDEYDDDNSNMVGNIDGRAKGKKTTGDPPAGATAAPPRGLKSKLASSLAWKSLHTRTLSWSPSQRSVVVRALVLSGVVAVAVLYLAVASRMPMTTTTTMMMMTMMNTTSTTTAMTTTVKGHDSSQYRGGGSSFTLNNPSSLFSSVSNSASLVSISPPSVPLSVSPSLSKDLVVVDSTTHSSGLREGLLASTASLYAHQWTPLVSFSLSYLSPAPWCSPSRGGTAALSC